MHMYTFRDYSTMNANVKQTWAYYKSLLGDTGFYASHCAWDFPCKSRPGNKEHARVKVVVVSENRCKSPSLELNTGPLRMEVKHTFV